MTIGQYSMIKAEGPRAGLCSPGVQQINTSAIGLVKGLMVLAVSVASLLAATTTNTDGYTPTAVKPGIQAASDGANGIGGVSLYTGGASISIPLLDVGGRGHAGYTIVLPLQRLWRIETLQSNSDTDYAALPPDGPNTVLWAKVPLFSPGALFQRTAPGAVQVCSSCGFNFYTTTVSRLTFVAGDGSESDLVDTASGGDILNDAYNEPASRGTTFVSRDGSFLQFTSDSPVVDDYYQGHTGTADTVSGYLRMNVLFIYRRQRRG